jgi:hypothetical protein
VSTLPEFAPDELCPDCALPWVEPADGAEFCECPDTCLFCGAVKQFCGCGSFDGFVG